MQEAAQLTKALLDALELHSFQKRVAQSPVVVPITSKLDWDTVKDFRRQSFNICPNVSGSIHLQERCAQPSR